jgi:hypothetical protein
MRTFWASSSPLYWRVSTFFTTPLHTAKIRAAVAPMPATRSNRTARGRVVAIPGRKWAVVGSVFEGERHCCQAKTENQQEIQLPHRWDSVGMS